MTTTEYPRRRVGRPVTKDNNRPSTVYLQVPELKLLDQLRGDRSRSSVVADLIREAARK